MKIFDQQRQHDKEIFELKNEILNLTQENEKISAHLKIVNVQMNSVNRSSQAYEMKIYFAQKQILNYRKCLDQTTNALHSELNTNNIRLIFPSFLNYPTQAKD